MRGKIIMGDILTTPFSLFHPFAGSYVTVVVVNQASINSQCTVSRVLHWCTEQVSCMLILCQCNDEALHRVSTLQLCTMWGNTASKYCIQFTASVYCIIRQGKKTKPYTGSYYRTKLSYVFYCNFFQKSLTDVVWVNVQ